MKKKISELLDCLEHNPLPVQERDIVSAERIKELTMRKINNEYTHTSRVKRRRFTAAAAIAAVILAVALGGTAIAANSLGVRDYFGALFSHAETEMSNEQLAILEETVAQDKTADENKLPPAVTSNGTTMTPIAAVYDQDSYYLALRVEAPEGTVLDRGEAYWQLSDPDEPETFFMLKLAGYDSKGVAEKIKNVTEEDLKKYLPEDINFEELMQQATADKEADRQDSEALETLGKAEQAMLEDLGYKNFGFSSSTMFQDDTPGDNAMTIVVDFVKATGGGANAKNYLDFSDGQSKIVTIQGLWLQTPDKVYTKILDGVWTFDIGKYGVAGDPASM